MMDFDSALMVLRQDIQGIFQLETERLNILNSPLPPAQKDERASHLAEEIERRRKMMRNVMQEVVDFPPQHTRHSPVLSQFHQTATFDKSVFVMTKFPDAKAAAALNAELNSVIQAVRDAVKDAGYVARLASDAQYHGLLWDNVELYLLGCFRGIAIVEDKYIPELNPNVAMEWGWMRGMGRKVLYLVEKDFKKQRADWGGLIEHQFDWANPAPDIKAGIAAWLK